MARPDGGVEDATEPDNEANDAGGVHRGRGPVVIGWAGSSRVAKHQGAQVRLAPFQKYQIYRISRLQTTLVSTHYKAPSVASGLQARRGFEGVYLASR